MFYSETANFSFEDVSIVYGNNLKAIDGRHCIYRGDVKLESIIDYLDIITVFIIPERISR